MTGRRWLGIGAEILLLTALGGGWIAAWVATKNDLEGSSPAVRSITLALWSTSNPLWPALVLGLAAVAALALRHRWPAAAFVLIVVLTSITWWRYLLVSANSFVLEGTLVIATFWAVRRVSPWWPIAIGAIVCAVTSNLRLFDINGRLESLGLSQSGNLQSVASIIASLILVALAIGAGLAVRRVRVQAELLELRNRELEEQRAAAEQAAVLGERVRIARELHDVVAHHVTTMTVHAGAARQLGNDNPTVTEALQNIENSGRDAVGELHRLLGFLRGEDAESPDRSPAPSLRRVEALTETLGDGLACRVDITGDLGAVPQPIDVSAYRIIQEALTNTMKHSNATTVGVTVDCGADRLALHVHDNGSGAAGLAHPSSGHGLVGMRERASLHGGDIEAGPGTRGGWTVQATLPYPGRTQ